MGNLITAESARETSRNAVKLLNIISKEIKNAAEFGRKTCIVTFPDISSEVEAEIITTFTEVGFKVEVYVDRFENMLSETESIPSANYSFVFSW